MTRRGAVAVMLLPFIFGATFADKTENECKGKPLTYKFKLLGELSDIDMEAITTSIYNLTLVDVAVLDTQYSTRTVYAMYNFTGQQSSSGFNDDLGTALGLVLDEALGEGSIAYSDVKVVDAVAPAISVASVMPPEGLTLLADVDTPPRNGSDWAAASELASALAELGWEDIQQAAATSLRSPVAAVLPGELARFVDGAVMQIAGQPRVQAAVSVLIPNDCVTMPGTIKQLMQEHIRNGTFAELLGENVLALTRQESLAPSATAPSFPEMPAPEEPASNPVVPEGGGDTAEGEAVEETGAVLPELSNGDGKFEMPDDVPEAAPSLGNLTEAINEQNNAHCNVMGAAVTLAATAATMLLL